MRKVSLFVSFILCLMLITAPAFGDSIKKSKGQTVYVPAIYNCYKWADAEADVSCLRKGTTRLIIRNVDLDYAIAITSISIYGPDGEHLYEYISEGPIEISPLSSKTFPFPGHIEIWDANEDARPNFIVKWEVTKKKVIPPIIEAGRAFVNFSEDGSWSLGGLAITPGTVLKIKN